MPYFLIEKEAFALIWQWDINCFGKACWSAAQGLAMYWLFYFSSSASSSKRFPPQPLSPAPPRESHGNSRPAERTRNPQVFPRISSRMDMPKTPPRGRHTGGILTWSLNQLSWLLWALRSSSSTLLDWNTEASIQQLFSIELFSMENVFAWMAHKSHD